MKKKISSIRFHLMVILIMISSVVTVMIITLTLNQEKNISRYSDFSIVNSDLGGLPLKISRLSDLFYNYISQRHTQLAEEYKILNASILIILQNFIPPQNNEALFFYKRTMMNMMEEQAVITQKIFDVPGDLDAKAFREILYLNKLFKAMDNQAKSLAVSYLSYSNNEYRKNLNITKTRNMWIISAVISLFLLSLIISIIIVINISRTIQNLALASDRLSEKGVLLPDLKKTPYKGLNKVIVAFNGMKNSIKENLEKEKLLRQAQLQNLQSQINPHFLFNTLNIISRKALHNKTDHVINLIASISQILRFNMETDSDMISLSEELQILKAYLYIQETRFEDRIWFELNCRGDYSDIMCPPMILQPLVENSIIHGFKDLEEPGMVNISMEEYPEGIEIKIRDNGCGFHVHRLQGNEGKVSSNRKKSLGIYNVSRRLELHFKRTDLFSIQSSPDTGTEVTLLIPHKVSSIT